MILGSRLPSQHNGDTQSRGARQLKLVEQVRINRGVAPNSSSLLQRTVGGYDGEIPVFRGVFYFTDGTFV